MEETLEQAPAPPVSLIALAMPSKRPVDRRAPTAGRNCSHPPPALSLPSYLRHVRLHLEQQGQGLADAARRAQDGHLIAFRGLDGDGGRAGSGRAAGRRGLA